MTRRRALAPAERRYMLDAAIGLSAKESARKHGVSRNTVLGSLARAKRTLNASNITQAAVRALAYGDITFEDITREGPEL